MAATGVSNVVVFGTDSDADKLIKEHEIRNGLQFPIRKTKLCGLTRVSSLEHHRIKFDDNLRETIPVPFDGVPFIIISCDLRECQYGPNRHKSQQEKQDSDHIDHAFIKKRRLIQPSKKCDCPAKIKIRRLIKFPDFKIEGPDSKWKRRNLSKRLREEFDSSTRQEYMVMVQFTGTHQNHVTASKLLTSHQDPEEQAVDDCEIIVDSCSQSVISPENAKGTSVDIQDGSNERSSVLDKSEPDPIKCETVAHHEDTTLFVHNTNKAYTSNEHEEKSPKKKNLPERRKEKRKLSCFVYANLKKRKLRVYCICQKPYDKRRFMIQCDKCTDWFHLDCIGMNQKDIPKKEDTFFCNSCKEISVTDDVTKRENNAEEVHDMKFVPTTEWKTVNEEKVSTENTPEPEASHNFYRPDIINKTDIEGSDSDIQDLGSEDDLPGKNRRISGKTALEVYPVVVEELKDVLMCVESECDAAEHRRHHHFIKNPLEVIRVEKKKFGFGQEYFSITTIEVLAEKLLADLLYKIPDKKSPVTSLPSSMVRHIPKDSVLWNLFVEHKLIAFQYIVNVLKKEVLIRVASGVSMASYKNCEDMCLTTEMDSKKVFGI